MALIREGALVDDAYTHLDDEAAAPAKGPISVSWDRWLRDREALTAREGPLGVRLPNTIEPAEVAPDLGRFALIAIPFPRFTDGRGYSLARLLRERYGFAGELRAIGNVLRDQLFYLRRCGFDAFELEAGKDAEGALAAFGEFDVTYQPAADEAQPLWRRVERG